MTESSARVISGGSSGSTCNASGPYMCGTHTDTVLYVKRNQKYPNCPISKNRKGHSTTWSATSEGTTQPPSSVDNLDAVAL
jgi:hypothetical protein